MKREDLEDTRPEMKAAFDRLDSAIEELTSQLMFAAGGNTTEGFRGSRPRPDLAKLAGILFEMRRRREKYIPSRLLGEPHWDIMLYLFQAQHQGREISITKASYASSVPPTTGLRAINALEQDGLIERQASKTSNRSVNVQLSLEGHKVMEQALMAVLEGHL